MTYLSQWLHTFGSSRLSEDVAPIKEHIKAIKRDPQCRKGTIFQDVKPTIKTTHAS